MLQLTLPVAKETREELFITLYKEVFPPAATFISKMGGSFDEAKDIFQDALVIYYEQSIAGKLKPAMNEHAYIFGIVKHLWLKKHRETRHVVPLSQEEELLAATVAEYKAPQTNRLMHYLEKTGKKCMDILQSFYYHKLPMVTIAARLGYSGSRSATVQKYKCLEKIRETIHQNTGSYEDFLD